MTTVWLVELDPISKDWTMPAGIFTTEQLAEEYLAKQGEDSKNYSINEVELDKELL